MLIAQDDFETYMLQSVFISKVIEGGAAARDGRLRAGDQIVSVWLLSSLLISLAHFYRMMLC